MCLINLLYTDVKPLIPLNLFCHFDFPFLPLRINLTKLNHCIISLLLIICKHYNFVYSKNLFLQYTKIVLRYQLLSFRI